jgi:carboxyl-terminal processing protease
MALAQPLMLPEAIRLDNGIGVVRLYSFQGSPEHGQRYAQTGQAKIDALRSLGVCKFVVDLRSNMGGNMYPMIDSISGLLDDGVLGTFESAKGAFSSWVLKDGKTTAAWSPDARPRAIEPASNSMPVAVLIGPSTASAGEYTAMSFKGRANTRFFGAPTAGYITANHPVPLSDGAVIVMTGAWGIDRTGRKYVDAMHPDEATGGGGPTMDAAAAWLARQRCSPPH